MRTTVRSRISPGICEELKSEVTPFCLSRIWDTMGFQVTTADARRIADESVGDIGIGGVDQADALDLIAQAVEGHGAVEQVFGDGLLDEQELLAGEVLELEVVAHQQGVVAVGVVADQDDGGGHAGGGGHIERFHVGHGAGVDVLGDEGVEGRGVVEALDLDGDAVLVGPLVEDPGLVHVVVRGPSGVDGPAHGEGGFLGQGGNGNQEE